MDKKTNFFRIIHKVTAAVAFASVLLPILLWKRIPESVPAHFDGAGFADRWSDKSSLVLLFFLVFLLFGMMSVVEYFIRSSGLSEHASASERQNFQTLYPAIVTMNLFVQLIFAYIIFCSAACRELGKWFLPAALIGTFSPIVWYIVQYYKTGRTAKEEMRAYREREKSKMEQGIVYHTKIDVWLAVCLGGALAMSLWSAADSLMKGRQELLCVGTAVFVALIVIPMFFIRYTLYTDYILIDCSIFGKERIPYKSITKIQKTYNPLSSAAMSLKRIQIDYTLNGRHDMTLISPVRREEFIKEVEKRRGL